MKQVARGAIMTIPQAWDLSQRWYGTRLDPDFRRPTADEARAIFASVGLTGRSGAVTPSSRSAGLQACRDADLKVRTTLSGQRYNR